MIREMLKMGHPMLRDKAQEIEHAFIQTNEFRELLIDLEESMIHYGGIGLAGPQIGVGLQIAIIKLSGMNRYNELIELPKTYFINPQITILDHQTKGYWEGCLSVPGLRGFVERAQKIKVNYIDENGHPRELVAENFLATVIQHELDHLEGLLYIDRLKDTRLLSFQNEFVQFHSQSLDLDHE